MDGYSICGPLRTWRDELRKFSMRRVEYIWQGCEECEALSNLSCSIQPSSYSMDDVMLMPEEEEVRFGADHLDNFGQNRPRRLYCPWASFLSAPSLRTISVESAKFPFLMVIKPGEEACFLKNLALPQQVELKHQEIRPFCSNYMSVYPQVKKVPHCCFYFRCFYSRRSWMLLYERYPACCRKFSVLVLLNPLTNQRTDLPVIGPFKIMDAAFSVSDTDANASPDCVVAIVSKGTNSFLCPDAVMCLAMWRPSWKSWEIHETVDPDLSVDSYLGMVFCGKRVRCFTESGWMYVFDLNGDQGCWGISRNVHDPDKGVNHSQFGDHLRAGDSGRIRVTVAGGYGSCNFSLGRDSNEILKILSWPDEAGNRVYCFYKLDRLELEWIKLEKGEWIDRSWFFTNEYVFSTPTVGGGKMFRKSHAPTEKDRVKIICDDLLGNTRHSLVGDFLRGCSWVFLGC